MLLGVGGQMGWSVKKLDIEQRPHCSLHRAYNLVMKGTGGMNSVGDKDSNNLCTSWVGKLRLRMQGAICPRMGQSQCQGQAWNPLDHTGHYSNNSLKEDVGSIPADHKSYAKFLTIVHQP